ncbi:MAG: ATP-dependent helicase HrpB [Sandaracinaceae bacterium]|nr:ATP-dependent helicase HrpB [Sandaracinaceae bacterium]
MIRLPIDERVGEIVAAVRARNLVLVAEPGAGKTTRVPRALLDAGLLETGRCVVLEPRRLAARMAARRVAEELSDARDKRVGWQVRFEDTTTAATRIAFVTEGILTRRFVSDPTLRGTSVVILDEFHERHLHADVALALLRRLQTTSRPDLRIVVMSATLEAQSVAAFLDAEVMHVAGRRFDVTFEYLEKAEDKHLDAQVASALRNVLARESVKGDVLVFLPGAGEIRRAKDACTDIAARANIELAVLHGDLPAEEQDRAVRPGSRRKVILSTNVAESSVTIEGVGVVIDSGQARVASHSAWTGMPKLVTTKISQASAVQRAGRAGRLREGFCFRLYTKYDFETRSKHDVPEIKRADLAETALHLHALGENDLAAFPWFEAPIPAALEAASRLLLDLGAVKEGSLTEIGKRMQSLPSHPRGARLLIEAKDRGVGARGAMLAALLGEREIRARSRTQLHAPRGAKDTSNVESGDSDLIARLLELEAVEALGMNASRLRQHELDGGAAQAVMRSRDQLARALGCSPSPTASLDDEEGALLHATLAAFPDRVARRARALGSEVAFSRGGGATLAEDTVVREAQFLVAVDAEERRGTNVVRLASAIEVEWLLEMFPNDVTDGSTVRFDAKTERVETVSALMYGALSLDESKRSDVRSEAVGSCLANAALLKGPASFCDADALLKLQRRAAFVAQHRDGFPAFDDEMIARVVNEMCSELVALSELRDADVISNLMNSLTSQQRTTLDRDAPTHVTLPGGRRAEIQYEPGKPPFIESRLQDFFGMKAGPALVDGRVPLVLHLLAPNYRAVQVTTDLAGFWDRHYATIKKELARKYPRHSWPDDPRTAQPPPPKPPRR